MSKAGGGNRMGVITTPHFSILAGRVLGRRTVPGTNLDAPRGSRGGKGERRDPALGKETCEWHGVDET